MLYFFSISFLLAVVYFYSMAYDSYIFPREIGRIQAAIKNNRGDSALILLKRIKPKMTLRFETQYAFYQAYLLSNHWYLALYHLNEISFHKLYSKKEQIDDIEIHLKKAELYEILKRGKDVLNEYYKILQKQPKHTLANEKIGNKLFQMKNYAIALPFLEKAFLFQKDNSKLAEKLSDIYVRERNFHKAKDCIEAAISSEKIVHCRLKHKRISILYQLEDYDEIIKTALSIDSSYKQSEDVRLMFALSLFRSEHYAQAFQNFQEILTRHLNNYSKVVISAREIFFEMLMNRGMYEDGLEQLHFIADQSSYSYREEISFFTVLNQQKALLEVFTETKDVKKIQTLNAMLNKKQYSIIPDSDGVRGFKKLMPAAFFVQIQVTPHAGMDELGGSNNKASAANLEKAIILVNFHHKKPGAKLAKRVNEIVSNIVKPENSLFKILNLREMPSLKTKLYVFSSLSLEKSFYAHLENSIASPLLCLGKNFLHCLSQNSLALERCSKNSNPDLSAAFHDRDEVKPRQLHTVHAFLGKSKPSLVLDGRKQAFHATLLKGRK